MLRLIRFSGLSALSFMCLSTTASTAKPEDVVAPPVAIKETKLLLEDAKQLEKARTELCTALLAKVQEIGQGSVDKENGMWVLSRLRYEPSINFTISQVGVPKSVRFKRVGNSLNIIRGSDANENLIYNFPAIQCLLNFGPSAIPPLVKAYIARRKELAEKPQEEPDVVLRNIEFTLYQLDNSENALLYLKRAIEGVRLKDVLGVEVEAMVELRVRIQEEVKRRR